MRDRRASANWSRQRTRGRRAGSGYAQPGHLREKWSIPASFPYPAGLHTCHARGPAGPGPRPVAQLQTVRPHLRRDDQTPPLSTPDSPPLGRGDLDVCVCMYACFCSADTCGGFNISGHCMPTRLPSTTIYRLPSPTGSGPASLPKRFCGQHVGPPLDRRGFMVRRMQINSCSKEWATSNLASRACSVQSGAEQCRAPHECCTARTTRRLGHSVTLCNVLFLPATNR